MKFLLIAINTILYFQINAQHQEINEKPNLWKDKTEARKDTSNTLKEAFKNGAIHGHLRYFFMATNNDKSLSDYYANAAGGGIKYETAPLHGIQLGVSGFFAFNIGSSDFTKTDPLTNSPNRYETALFEITDPQNKNDIDRLEELYLKYTKNKFSISIGKQHINTSFINLQDGRMRPTGVQGIFAEYKGLKKTTVTTGLLNKISPRSTVKWYSIGESIGIYSQGVNPDGSKSNYGGNIESNFVGLIGLIHKPTQNLIIKIDELFVENVMNTFLLQTEYKSLIKNNLKLNIAAQLITQNAIKNGGNIIENRTYLQKANSAFTYGFKLGIGMQKWNTSFNYNRITSSGRYLIPREWGRDPFFTFLPRERNDGYGDVNAYVVKTEYQIPKSNFKALLGLGYFNLPEVTNYALNKYGMPSYYQINFDLRYTFKGFFEGMETQFLFVSKIKGDDNNDNPKYLINKVNMQNWNFVLNYHF